MTPRRIAIAVMSFDRPHYLERILQNVAAQKPLRHGAAPVPFLFQDGAASPRTGRVYGDADRIAASVEVFRRYLPRGHVFRSEINLGVAMNFDRAERVLFEENGFDAAIFLEDDMLLRTDYFRTIEALLDAARGRPDIGMVSARGYRNDTPLSEQHRRAGEVRLMDEHNWAFALTRPAWEARDRLLRPYLAQVGGIDYRDRDRGARKIAMQRLQQAQGRHGRGYLTSQDSMKNLAMELLGLNRITTFTNNARYIGKEGEHSTLEKFLSRGYHRTVLYDGDHAGFDIPSVEDLARMRMELEYR